MSDNQGQINKLYEASIIKNVAAVVIIAIISICVPISIHIALKPTTNEAKVVEAKAIPVVAPQDTNSEILKLLQAKRYDGVLLMTNTVCVTNYTEIVHTNEVTCLVNRVVTSKVVTVKSDPESQTITWVGSPAMQNWQWNEKEHAWESAPVHVSVRSNPTLEFGLRADGVVVWKKIVK